MSDWIGLIFFVTLIVGIIAGLKMLAKPQKRTESEFERNAAEGAGAMGAGFNALNKLLNPESTKGKEVIMDLKDGRYNKKKREGKSGGTDLKEEDND